MCQGFEWLDVPKRCAAIIETSFEVGAKPQSSPGCKDFGKNDREALEEVEGKLYVRFRLAKLARYHVGTKKLVLKFHHQ